MIALPEHMPEPRRPRSWRERWQIVRRALLSRVAAWVALAAVLVALVVGGCGPWRYQVAASGNRPWAYIVDTWTGRARYSSVEIWYPVESEEDHDARQTAERVRRIKAKGRRVTINDEEWIRVVPSMHDRTPINVRPRDVAEYVRRHPLAEPCDN